MVRMAAESGMAEESGMAAELGGGHTDFSMSCRCRLMVDGGKIECVGGCIDGFRRRRGEQSGRSLTTIYNNQLNGG
jgi:hypothetical protein